MRPRPCAVSHRPSDCTNPNRFRLMAFTLLLAITAMDARWAVASDSHFVNCSMFGNPDLRVVKQELRLVSASVAPDGEISLRRPMLPMPHITGWWESE
jgi:hypothetical protein